MGVFLEISMRINTSEILFKNHSTPVYCHCCPALPGSKYQVYVNRRTVKATSPYQNHGSLDPGIVGKQGTIQYNRHHGAEAVKCGLWIPSESLGRFQKSPRPFWGAPIFMRSTAIVQLLHTQNSNYRFTCLKLDSIRNTQHQRVWGHLTRQKAINTSSNDSSTPWPRPSLSTADLRAVCYSQIRTLYLVGSLVGIFRFSKRTEPPTMTEWISQAVSLLRRNGTATSPLQTHG